MSFVRVLEQRRSVTLKRSNSCPLQDPVTGICYDDILMLDMLTWDWSFVEVMPSHCLVIS